jgi:hypothetical protein
VEGGRVRPVRHGVYFVHSDTRPTFGDGILIFYGVSGGEMACCFVGFRVGCVVLVFIT